MLLRLALLAPLSALLCLAQADTVSNQQVLGELRSIRALLEQLDRSQRALLVLARLQGDQTQLAALEAQRPRLAAREAELARRIADDKRILNAPAPQTRTAEGTVEPAPRADDGPWRARLAEAEAELRDTQERKRDVDEKIARLKLRIAAAEKLVDELLGM